jgi:hypothetical protein
LTLILVRISPTACRPSTNLPTLDHTAHHSQQWVTPELGLNSTRVKGFLTRLMYLRQQGKTLSQVPTQTNSLQSLIPHMPVPPQEVCPFSAQQSFGCPTSFLGFNNRPDRKSQSPVAAVWHLQEINSQQFSHLERISHGPDNLPLQYPMGSNPLLQSSSQANQVQVQVQVHVHGTIYKYRKV